MLGLFYFGLIFSIVAGFISMVPYMMKTIYHVNVATIGNSVIFPGTMSVIVFLFFFSGRKGHYLFYFRIIVYLYKFLTIAFLLSLVCG